MAIGGVVVNFTLKTRDAIQDALKLSRSLEHTSDDADDLDRSLDNVQGELDATGRAARDLSGDVAPAERSFQDLSREVSDSATKMRQDMGKMSGAVREGAADVDREASKMRHDMGELGTETGAEFVGNIAEGIGSGSGSIEDVVSGTLGGLTNLAATLTGPVGIAAGVAAAGIGLVFANVRKEAEDAKTRLDSMRGALEDIGDLGSDIAEQAVFEQWIKDAQTTTGKIEKVRDALGNAGVTADEFQGALAGDPKDLQTVVDKINAMKTGVEKAADENGQWTDEMLYTRDAADLVLDEVNKTDAAVGAVRREQDAVKDLTDGTIKSTQGWKRETQKVEDDTDQIKDNIDSVDGRTINLHAKWTESGKPGGLPGGKSVKPPPGGSAAPPSGPTTFVTINYTAGVSSDPHRDGRVLKRIIEGNDTEQGRTPGQRLRVAW